MKIEYKGEQISIYRLGKLTGVALSVLYRYYHNGMRDGDAMTEKAFNRRVTYQGKRITVRHLAILTGKNYRGLRRRIGGGMTPEEAVNDKKERRGAVGANKLSPSNVMTIYQTVFNKEKTQAQLAKEYGVHQSTISDIWTHRRWGWLTAALRYDLELNGDKA